MGRFADPTVPRRPASGPWSRIEEAFWEELAYTDGFRDAGFTEFRGYLGQYFPWQLNATVDASDKPQAEKLPALVTLATSLGFTGPGTNQGPDFDRQPSVAGLVSDSVLMEIRLVVMSEHDAPRADLCLEPKLQVIRDMLQNRRLSIHGERSGVIQQMVLGGGFSLTVARDGGGIPRIWDWRTSITLFGNACSVNGAY